MAKKCCCDCKHFRMWKPEPEYCTVKKSRVDPLKTCEACWVGRKGLKDILTGKEISEYV